MEMTDFGNSYMTWSVPHDPSDQRKPGHKPWGNSARILLDARCTIINTASGATDDFYLVAPCRTEWMYQDEHLFQLPSGEYREIFSSTRRLNLGKRLTVEGEQPRSLPALAPTAPTPGAVRIVGLTSLEFTIGTYPVATALTTDADVVAATQQNLPLGGVTEIWEDARNLRAVLEYPIKTMNFHPERQRFQVDTGPLIVPDLAAPEAHWMDTFSLAHIIYNTFERAEFICRRPTPLLVDGREVAQLLHYNEVRVLPARHTLLCGGELPRVR
jgi:hypothetical protein